MITNDRGEVLFATQQAQTILQTLFIERVNKIVPNEIRTWLIKGDTSKPLVVRHPAGRNQTLLELADALPFGARLLKDSRLNTPRK